MSTKVCRICQLAVSLDLYYKRSAAKDGLETACKSCRSKPRIKKTAATTEQPSTSQSPSSPSPLRSVDMRTCIWAYGYTMKALMFAVWSSSASDTDVDHIKSEMSNLIKSDPDYKAGLIKSNGRYKRSKGWYTMNSTLTEIDRSTSKDIITTSLGLASEFFTTASSLPT